MGGPTSAGTPGILCESATPTIRAKAFGEFSAVKIKESGLTKAISASLVSLNPDKSSQHRLGGRQMVCRTARIGDGVKRPSLQVGTTAYMAPQAPSLFDVRVGIARGSVEAVYRSL